MTYLQLAWRNPSIWEGECRPRLGKHANKRCLDWHFVQREKMYLRPFAAMQFNWRGLLIRQPLKGALDHVLSMTVGQLGARLDDTPACPLG